MSLCLNSSEDYAFVHLAVIDIRFDAINRELGTLSLAFTGLKSVIYIYMVNSEM